MRRDASTIARRTALVIALLSGGWVALHCAAQPAVPADPVDRAPWPKASPHLTVPPAIEDRVIYFNSFSAGMDKPEIDLAAAKRQGKPVGQVVEGGFSGKGLLLKGRESYLIKSPRFAVHRPITVSMWWRLDEPMPHNSGASFLRLTDGGRGYLSVFARGGPWCALKDTALVLQVYNIKGVRDVNGILNRRFRQTARLDEKTWHHMVLTVSMGSRVKLFLDGQRVALLDLKGRTFDETDTFNFINFGAFGPGMVVDDLMVLDVTLTDDQVGELYTSLTQLKEIGYLD